MENPLSSDIFDMCLKMVAWPLKGLTLINLKKSIGFVIFSDLFIEVVLFPSFRL